MASLLPPQEVDAGSSDSPLSNRPRVANADTSEAAPIDSDSTPRADITRESRQQSVHDLDDVESVRTQDNIDPGSSTSPDLNGRKSNAQEAATNQASGSEQETSKDAADADHNKPMGWDEILKTMEEQDQRMVTDWKTDLSNLLVFAGLFSSVVSNFTVASLTSLQPAGPDPWLQVQFLAQISTQLSSLTISPGFLNSTNPPNPMLVVPAPESTPKMTTLVSKLWFLSLGCSLVASLFAVVAQEWLREYLRCYNEVDSHQRVRLRQLRYQALLDWGVPQIIGALPVLLQAAFILFLSGLCLLLDTLDTAVANSLKAFMVVAVVAYSAFTLLPTAYPQRCPYKSQLVDFIYHAITAIGLIIGLVPWSTLIYIPFTISLSVIGVIAPNAMERHYGGGAVSFITSINQVLGRMLLARAKALLSFGQGRFWQFNETSFMNTDTQASSLDVNALIWVRSVVPLDKRRFVDLRLRDLTKQEQAICGVSLASQALGFNPVSALTAEAFVYGPAPPLAETIKNMLYPPPLGALEKVDHDFAQRFKTPLLYALRKLQPFDVQSPVVFQDSGMMVLLILHTAITKLNERPSSDLTKDIHDYTQCVMTIRRKQSEAQLLSDWNTLTGWVRLPTQCLYGCSTALHYDFDDREITELLNHAKNIQDIITDSEDDRSLNVQKSTLMARALPIMRMPVLRIISHRLQLSFLSAAAALHALSQRNSEQPWPEDWSAKCQSLIMGVDKIAVRCIIGSGNLFSRNLVIEAWRLGSHVQTQDDSIDTLRNSIEKLHTAGLLPDYLPSEENVDGTSIQIFQSNLEAASKLIRDQAQESTRTLDDTADAS